MHEFWGEDWVIAEHTRDQHGLNRSNKLQMIAESAYSLSTSARLIAAHWGRDDELCSLLQIILGGIV